MNTISIETYLVPISESEPVGDDARYEFCYEMMEAEIKKFGSLFGETVDWNVVQTHATEVLTQHSKDLKAFCYISRAMVELDKFDGLEQGLTLIIHAISNYSSALFPRRKRGRDGALEWFVTQLENALPKIALEQTSWEQLSRCTDLVGEIQRQYSDAFPDADVDFFAIRAVINSLMERASLVHVGEPIAESELTPSPETQVVENTLVEAAKPVTTIPSPAAPPVVKPVRAELDVDTDFSTPSASKRSLKNVAEAILHADIGAPLAYRIHRYLTWCDIDELPGYDQDNRTPLALAVSNDQQANYRDKAKQETDADTIKRLERTMTDVPFWLTGHFLVFQMLNNLGREGAALAVKQEVIQFTKSLPGIERLQFSNAIPFADEATLDWLSSGLSSSSSSHTPLQTVVLTEDELSSMDDVSLETLGECVANIAQRLEKDGSGRGQFMLHLQMIKAYHCVGLFPLCLPYLEKIWSVRAEMDLASWEPHLCLQLDSLAEATLTALYPNKDQMPEKYQEWTSIYN
ncbi:type VI secretion system protein TssA [uncultured Photobacterium sp.]|uniref:type VI secretion system protein TssA n=1 Tax=uncultured Photobacterium sp. TaxID=173973 RepID=UPI0026049098|nr:type VI secretion system protein TssA [uncultured Photobacterium sp.]